MIWKWCWKIFFNQIVVVVGEKFFDFEFIEDEDGKMFVLGKDLMFGVDVQIKMFFEGKNFDVGYYDWVDYLLKQIFKVVSCVQDRVVIKVYKIKDCQKLCIQGWYFFKFYKIEIQNFIFVVVLEFIVKKENVNFDINEMVEFNYFF